MAVNPYLKVVCVCVCVCVFQVCEQQVASLHSKVLQFQQQLTLAVAADRKKDIMIEQLDKVHTHTLTHTHTHTHRQTDRQTDRHTHTETHSDTHTLTHTH